MSSKTNGDSYQDFWPHLMNAVSYDCRKVISRFKEFALYREYEGIYYPS